jgi:HSP20 family protein
MPGVPKTGVKLDLEDSILTVRGERNATVPEGMKALHRELSPLSYILRLRLNTPVDEDKMTAKLEDGVLSIRLPLKEVAKPRQITVQ